MTSAIEYACDRCGARAGLGRAENLCRDCGGLLEIRYDLSKVPAGLRARAAGARAENMWRWRDLLPVDAATAPVSLGEGDTPLLAAGGLSERLGLRRLWLKNDTLMPTGSFKDRGFSLAVTVARQLGIRRAFTYSSGNAGASLAAYAARAGMDAAVLVEYLASAVKVAAIRGYGAQVISLRFRSSAEIFGALEAIEGQAPYSFVNFINPVRHEAMKTYAYEICEALGWRAPDVMLHPIGTGGGLYGAWKGFRELRELGWIDRLPRMIGVQPRACAPIVAAVERGDTLARPAGDPAATIAQSIAADAPIGQGERVLRAIRESGGTAVAVSDSQLADAMRLLGREGILAEPSAASSLAGLAECLRAGTVAPGSEAVCVITGSALKQPAELASLLGGPVAEVDAGDPGQILKALAGVWHDAPEGRAS
jgi:threonine synthase